MSQITDSVSPVPVVGLIDAKVNVNAKLAYVALKGGKSVQQKDFTTTSYSNSAFNFSCPPPSPNIVVDRLVWLKATFQAVFDVDVRSSASGLGLNVGLRQFPLTSVIQNIQATINNVTISQNISDYVHGLMRYSFSKKKHDKGYSTTPSMPDQYQDYVQWQDVATGGSARNPLSAYGEQYYQNRGAFVPDSISADGKTLQYTVMEPLLLLSPFVWDPEEENVMGLANVNTIDFVITLSNNLSRMFSVVTGGGAPAVTSINVNFASVPPVTLPSPTMHFLYISPSDIMSIPRSLVYPYCNIDRYISPGETLASGASTSTNSNNIITNQIPKRCYIFIRQRNADQTFRSSDTFASITRLDVNFNNYNGIFSSMDQQDLYQMSRRNGLDMSWEQFSNFCGSVIAFDFGTDVGLSPVESPGLLGNYNLQYTVTYKNTSAGTISYDIFTILCNEGTFEIRVGSGVPQTGILSKSSILNSENLPQMDYHDVKMQGGNVFGKLKSFVSGAAKIGKQVGSIGKVLVPQLAPEFSALEGVSSALGGRKMYRRGRGLVGAGLEKMPKSKKKIDLDDDIIDL